MSDEKTSSNIVLSFEDLFYSLSDDNIDKLYPSMPDKEIEHYADNVMFNPKNLVDSYNDLPIKPIIRSVDLNCGQDELKPKTAWQIGFEFDF